MRVNHPNDWRRKMGWDGMGWEEEYGNDHVQVRLVHETRATSPAELD